MAEKNIFKAWNCTACISGIWTLTTGSLPTLSDIHQFLYALQRSKIVSTFSRSEAVRWRRDVKRGGKLYLKFVGSHHCIKHSLTLPGSSLLYLNNLFPSPKACTQERCLLSSYHHNLSVTWRVSPHHYPSETHYTSSLFNTPGDETSLKGRFVFQKMSSNNQEKLPRFSIGR